MAIPHGGGRAGHLDPDGPAKALPGVSLLRRVRVIGMFMLLYGFHAAIPFVWSRRRVSVAAATTVSGTRLRHTVGLSREASIAIARRPQLTATPSFLAETPWTPSPT